MPAPHAAVMFLGTQDEALASSRCTAGKPVVSYVLGNQRDEVW